MTDEPRKPDYRSQQLEMKADYQKHLLSVARGDAWMRRFLGFLLVVGLFAVVCIGVVNKQAASDLSPLVAPLASLAGIAVGYYFGQGSSPALDLDEANERPS